MAFRARLAALYLSGWLCVFRQSVWGKTEAVRQGLPTSSGLEVREGPQASKNPAGHLQSTNGLCTSGRGILPFSILGNSGISAVPGLRAYGHLPKDVSTGYGILLLTAK